MRLRAAALLAVLLLVWAAPAPARAGCEDDGKNLIALDIKSGRFTDSVCVAHFGSKLTLRVLHPNLFRDDYALTMKGIDYHVLSLPSELKIFATTTTPSVSDLELQTVNAAGPRVGIAARSLVSQAVLDSAYIHASNSFKSISWQARRVARSANETNLAVALRLQLIRATDNRLARRAALESVADVAKRWVADTSLARSFAALRDRVPRAEEESADLVVEESAAAITDLDLLLNEFTSRSREWQSAWDDAQFAWAQALADWKSKATDAELVGPLGNHAKACDEQIQAANKWMQSLQTALSDRQKDLTSYVAIAGAAVDVRRTPAVLTRVATATGDEVVASVAVSPHPVATDSEKDLPQRPARTFTWTTAVRYRWALDVSAGLAATTLKQKNYFVDAGGVVREGASDEYDLRAAVFLESVYTGWTPFGLNYAWVIPALGVTVSNPVRYLLGGGIQLGGGIRANLLGGLAVGEVSVPHGEEPGQPLATSTLEVKSVVRSGWFASVAVTIVLPVPKSSSNK